MEVLVGVEGGGMEGGGMDGWNFFFLNTILNSTSILPLWLPRLGRPSLV